jgi:hypothetical protein
MEDQRTAHHLNTAARRARRGFMSWLQGQRELLRSPRLTRSRAGRTQEPFPAEDPIEREDIHSLIIELQPPKH